jgi:thymidylate kinase
VKRVLGRRGFLVCVIGLDGSGKTTHTNHLVKFLSEKGYSAKYVWAASKPFFSYFLFGLTRLLGYWKTSNKDAFTDPLELASEPVREKLGLLVRILFFVDFNLRTITKIRLPLLLGRIIVCDRYVYDIIMDLMYSDLYSFQWYSLLIRTVPKPDIAFFLDADAEVICSRRSNFSINTMRRKRKVYSRFAQIFGFHIFNTSNSFIENQNGIREETAHVLETKSKRLPR